MSAFFDTTFPSFPCLPKSSHAPQSGGVKPSAVIFRVGVTTYSMIRQARFSLLFQNPLAWNTKPIAAMVEGGLNVNGA